MTSSSQHSPLSDDQRAASLRASVKDGMFYAASVGSGESFISAFGVLLRGSTVQIGLLSSLPPFIGALAQTLSVWLSTHISSRRLLISIGATAQAFCWFPIAALPFLLGPGKATVALLICLMAIYQIFYGLTVPAWNALIGDIVPPSQRGVFFGRRNRVIGLSTFVSLTAAGSALYSCDRITPNSIMGSLIGFACIFSAAGIFRFCSGRQLARHADPAPPHDPDSFFTFLQFLRRVPTSNFGRFVLFFSIISFAINFSGPYFALYMLRELKFSYLQFTVITAVATVAQFMTMQHWGRISDKFGNKRIINLCGFGVVVSPWLWLINTSPPYLVLVQIYAGFVWAGYNLAATNFLFDSVAPAKRARCAAYQSLVSATLVLCGSLAGGYSASHLESWLAARQGNAYSALPVIFFASGLIRLVAAAILLPRFREVREVPDVDRRDFLFQVLNLKPFSGSSLLPLSEGGGSDREEDGEG